MSRRLLPHTNLPVEVIEHILDLLHVNIDDLRQFALTCRALLIRARHHLFYAIRLQATQQDLESLCQVFNANPHLKSLVRIVTLHFPPDESPLVKASGFPARLLGQLPRLCHWKLSTDGIKSSRLLRIMSFHWTTLAFLKTTKLIQTLELKGLKFIWDIELVRLLASLPLLQDLRCSDIVSHNTTTVVGVGLVSRGHGSLGSLRVCTLLWRFHSYQYDAHGYRD